MSLKDAFAGMKQARVEPEQPEQEEVQRAKTPQRKTPKPRNTRAADPEPVMVSQELVGKTGKSSSPEFERLTVYVRKQTKKVAARKWEDETGGDMSELVQDLLTKYLSA